VLRTKPVHYQSVLAVIKKLDRKPKQVIIEVLIAEVTLEDDFELGISYALAREGPRGSRRTGQLGNIVEATTTPFTDMSLTSVGKGGLTVFAGTPTAFLAFLETFAKDNNLSILSSPSILATENQEAVINVVTDEPIPQSTTDPETQDVTVSFEFKDVGVKLKITPKITDDRFVTLEIEQELSERGDLVVTAEGFSQSSFLTRKAKTTVSVKDNQTIIIGGLISERDEETVTGIPFLNRIPILKHIFGSTVIEKDRRELLVMLTPRVIINEGDARAISDLYNERLQTLQKFLKEQNMLSR
jgi:general secretion pathway protein D